MLNKHSLRTLFDDVSNSVDPPETPSTDNGDDTSPAVEPGMEGLNPKPTDDNDKGLEMTWDVADVKWDSNGPEEEMAMLESSIREAINEDGSRYVEYFMEYGTRPNRIDPFYVFITKLYAATEKDVFKIRMRYAPYFSECRLFCLVDAMINTKAKVVVEFNMIIDAPATLLAAILLADEIECSVCSRISVSDVYSFAWGSKIDMFDMEKFNEHTKSCVYEILLASGLVNEEKISAMQSSNERIMLSGHELCRKMEECQGKALAVLRSKYLK